jgi:hypothetical protein
MMRELALTGFCRVLVQSLASTSEHITTYRVTTRHLSQVQLPESSGRYQTQQPTTRPWLLLRTTSTVATPFLHLTNMTTSYIAVVQFLVLSMAVAPLLATGKCSSVPTQTETAATSSHDSRTSVNSDISTLMLRLILLRVQQGSAKQSLQRQWALARYCSGPADSFQQCTSHPELT